jgi:RimJ/RimL family protein N-acetyltransferase
VLEGNRRARRFYEACGFEPDGARQLLALGGLVPEVRYQLAAAPAG